jgi:hypothetical protein
MQRGTASLGSETQARSAALSAHEAGLVQLAYCSLPSDELDTQSFSQMIQRARLANAEHGITGLLLTNTRLVIQWIEGSRAAVAQLWSNIEQDSRHHSVVQLIYKERVSARLFDRFRVRHASRSEMTTIVREALALAQKDPALTQELSSPIATLSILLDTGLSEFYSALPAAAAPAKDQP